MPVRRKREYVETKTGPTGVVRGASNANAVQAGFAMSDMMAKEAARFARMMGEEAEEKAVALARNAVFTQDENGTPQFDEKAAEDFGRIGQRAFTSTIQRRYADRLANSVKAHVESAKIENPYDLEAFTKNVNDRLGKMAESVPGEYQGLFADLTSDMKTTAGAQIGRNQGRAMDQEQAMNVVSLTDKAIADAGEAFELGDYEGAQLLFEEHRNYILNQPTNVLSAQEKKQEIDRLTAEFAAKRIDADLDLETVTPAQLSTLMEGLQTGDNELREKFFEVAPGQYASDDVMRKTAARLNAYWQTANQRMSKAGNIEDLTILANGGMDDTSKHRDQTDLLVAQAAQITDPETGARRAMTPLDWMSMDDEQLSMAMTTMKNAGMPSTSLVQAFQMAANGTLESDQMEALLPVFSMLKMAPNLSGKVRDLTGKLGEEATRIFTLAEALTGNGGEHSYPVTEAMNLIQGLDDQEWSDENLMYVLNEQKEMFDFGDHVDNPDRARPEMRRRVMNEVFDGIDPTKAEIGEAMRLYETFLRLETKRDDAAELTQRAMEERWTEDEQGVMMGVRRSALHPDVRYKAPGADNLGQVIESGLKGLVADAAEPFERMTEYANRFATMFMPMMGLGYDARVDWGLDWWQAETWEIVADQKLRKMLNENPEMWERVDVPRRGSDGKLASPLRAGEHYKLVPDGTGSESQPVYRVFIIGPRGVRTELPERLDMREDFAEMHRKRAEAQETYARLLEKFNKGEIDFEEFWEKNPEGSVPDFNEWFPEE